MIEVACTGFAEADQIIHHQLGLYQARAYRHRRAAHDV